MSSVRGVSGRQIPVPVVKNGIDINIRAARVLCNVSDSMVQCVNSLIVVNAVPGGFFSCNMLIGLQYQSCLRLLFANPVHYLPVPADNAGVVISQLIDTQHEVNGLKVCR